MRHDDGRRAMPSPVDHPNRPAKNGNRDRQEQIEVPDVERVGKTSVGRSLQAVDQRQAATDPMAEKQQGDD